MALQVTTEARAALEGMVREVNERQQLLAVVRVPPELEEDLFTLGEAITAIERLGYDLQHTSFFPALVWRAGGAVAISSQGSILVFRKRIPR